MVEHLIYVNNWFSKYEVDRGEQVHYSVFCKFIISIYWKNVLKTKTQMINGLYQ
jgi:hypothetical protein